MNIEEATRLYQSMPDAVKAQLVGRLCFDLTIEYRAISSEPTVAQLNLEKLQGINEIQHKVSAQMLAYQSRRPERYPGNDFFLLLVKIGKNYGVAGRIQQSLMEGLQKAS